MALPRLNWNMGTLHKYANDQVADTHPTGALVALSHSIGSSSYWKVVNDAVASGSGGGGYPSLIVAPTSTSSSYTHMRIVFIAGPANTATAGPDSGDMVSTHPLANTAYDPMLYIGIAPFAGLTNQPKEICTASVDTEEAAAPGDWRKSAGGSTKGDIFPVPAAFSGFHALASAYVNSNQLVGGGGGVGATVSSDPVSGGLWILENEESLFVQINEDYTSHAENSMFFGGAGCIFVPYATSSTYGDPGRMFGLVGGSVVANTGYNAFPSANSNPFYINIIAHDRHFPASDHDTATNGYRHFAYNYGSASWLQCVTAKHLNDDLDERWMGQINQFRDVDGDHVLLPQHVHMRWSPYAAMGYWRQMTQCAKTYTRAIIRDKHTGSIQGFTVQKTMHSSHGNAGFYFHNRRTFTSEQGIK